MTMNRRDALKVGGLALFASAIGPAFAKAKPQRVLILGGTGFIGPHFVHALSEAGHTITLFNRGKRDPEAKHGVEQLLGDRNNDLKSLEGREWDVVVDNSGYLPKQLTLSCDSLRKHAKHYIFISSIAVYADFNQADIDEDYALVKLPAGADLEKIGDNYGGLKVLCEQIVTKSWGKDSAIIRPTYICGPGDTSDRFTYWPHRVAQGGEMIAPGSPADPVQYIDVRDLADFVRLTAEKRTVGIFNGVSRPRAATMGGLLDTAKRVSRAETTFAWASAPFLLEHKAIDGGMYASGEIPIWAPPAGPSLGHSQVSSKRAEKKGLKYRPLETTVRETLEWQKTRPPEKQKLRAGLSAEREAELLKALKG
jgi:2'-hydroxyisoflavone reductase